MQQLRSRWLLPLLLALLALGVAAAGRDAPVVERSYWIEPGASATVQDAAAVGLYLGLSGRAVLPIGAGKTLWMRLRISGAASQWLDLDIPVPLLDEAQLFQRQADGSWTSEAAGDRRAVSSWSRPGRYPSFWVAPEAAPVRTVYLRVQHSDPIGFETRITTSSDAAQRRLREYLAIGVVLGCLALFTCSCITHAWTSRQVDHVLYAGYALLMTLTIAAVTGVAGHLLWDSSPQWNDAAQGALPILLAGIHVLFLQHLCATYTRDPRLARAAQLLAAGILLAGAVYPLLSRATGSVVVTCALVSAALVGLALAARTRLLHGDAVGTAVLVAYVPLAAVVAVAMLRLNGLLAASWLSLDASALAAACAVPLLLVALNIRSRDWHRVERRTNAFTQQDALTGLLSESQFLLQLDRAVAGALMRGERAAVVLVEVANLQAIGRRYGASTAEQALLRAVVKLHRVVRESDPAGRVGTARFAVILEGLAAQHELQERMVRLVTSGLIPSRTTAAIVPLQFHVACMMLGPTVFASSIAMRKLSQVLEAMSARIRRPVRFVDLAVSNAHAGKDGIDSEPSPTPTEVG